MTRWAIRRRNPCADDGAILIFALIIISTIALVVGTLLTRGDGSLLATVALRSAAGSSYAADAAANIALNDLRTGQWTGTATKPNGWAYANDPFDGCFGRDGSSLVSDTTPTTGLALPGFYPATGTQGAPTSAYVVCTPENDTGQQGTPVAINNQNKPGNAILTLGTSTAEPGFDFKTNGSGGAFRVRGGIWSNSTITRDQNGTLESTESIRAHTACTPQSAMVAPVVNCSANTAPDPGYGSDLDLDSSKIPAALTLQTPPSTCNGTVELQPGYYDDAAALNALTPSGGGNCFVHLNPGTYYLDFHASSGTDPLALDANADTWNILSGTVVGGTLTTATTVPGRCVSPIDSTTANGVQLIFGGDSHMVVDKGAKVELCGAYHDLRPPIVVAGQRTGTAQPTVIDDGSALTTSGTPAVTSSDATAGKFVPSVGTGAVTAAMLTDSGNGSAVWQRTSAGANNATSTITMGGFAPPTALPKGTVLAGATLKIGHRTTGTDTITLTPTSGGTGLTAYDLPARTTLGVESVDLSQRAGWAAFQKSVHDNGFNGATLTFQAKLAKNQVSELDSARLLLTYYLPQLRQQAGTTVAVNGAPLILAQGNNTLFYTQGTTYVPASSLNLALNNISESVFRFGVIARSLQVFETASFSYPGAVIELPDNSPGWGTKSTLIQLKVYLCPASATCSDTRGSLALTARAQIWDPTGTTSPPGRQVTVLNWSHSH